MANNPNTYTTKQAADRIGITGQSVRRYTERFSRFLSPGAYPAPGATRTFTAEDVYILEQVYRGTQRGWTYDQIEEELETLVLPDIVEIEPEQSPQLPAIPEGLAVLQEIAQTLEATHTALQTLTQQQQDTQAIQRRLDTLSEAQRRQEEHLRSQPSPWIWLAIGAVLATVITLAIVAVALAAGWIG